MKQNCPGNPGQSSVAGVLLSHQVFIPHLLPALQAFNSGLNVLVGHTGNIQFQMKQGACCKLDTGVSDLEQFEDTVNVEKMEAGYVLIKIRLGWLSYFIVFITQGCGTPHIQSMFQSGDMTLNLYGF